MLQGRHSCEWVLRLTPLIYFRMNAEKKHQQKYVVHKICETGDVIITSRIEMNDCSTLHFLFLPTIFHINDICFSLYPSFFSYFLSSYLSSLLHFCHLFTYQIYFCVIDIFLSSIILIRNIVLVWIYANFTSQNNGNLNDNS